jgi:hypothetical protein
MRLLCIERRLGLDQLTFCIQLFIRLFLFVSNLTEAIAKPIRAAVRTVIADFFLRVIAFRCSSGTLLLPRSSRGYVHCTIRWPPIPRATAALRARTTMSNVSRSDSNSIFLFGWTRKPATCSLLRFDIGIFSVVWFICRSR